MIDSDRSSCFDPEYVKLFRLHVNRLSVDKKHVVINLTAMAIYIGNRCTVLVKVRDSESRKTEGK